MTTMFAKYRTKHKLPSWYPPLPTYQTLFVRLRRLGLFHDEHEDFIDEMNAKRASRGKGPPRKGWTADNRYYRSDLRVAFGDISVLVSK